MFWPDMIEAASDRGLEIVEYFAVFAIENLLFDGLQKAFDVIQIGFYDGSNSSAKLRFGDRAITAADRW